MKHLDIRILIQLALALACCLHIRAGGIGDTGEGFISLRPEGIKNLGIEYAVVERKDFESTIFAIGHIREIPQNHSVLSSRISGRIVSVNAFEGDMVKMNDVLVRVESRQPGNPPPVIELRAPRDGLIVASHIRLGEPVEPEKELLDIMDLEEVWATAHVPEDVISKIQPGTKAHIRIPALGGTSMDGELLRFEPKANLEGGTIGAIFKVPNRDILLRPAMRAEFSIVTSSRENVMAVPREALQGDDAHRVVYVKHIEIPNAFTRLPVQTGEQNDRYVEIISGLFPGDEVVTSGSYALSFASGSSLSLKEALDAAHGHEHNEDGSEMTRPQRDQAAANHADAHAHPHNKLVVFFSVSTLLLLVLLIISSIKHRRNNRPSQPQTEHMG